MSVLKRKRKNRRNEREHVLDVKMRSQHTRAVRTRMATTIFGLVLGLAVGVVAVWRASEWAMDEWVFRNAAFNIRVLDVETDGVIPARQLRAWAGVKEGDNLWAIDLFRVRRDMELQPLIESVAVERVLPHTLRIRVTEREPIAQITGFQTNPGGGVKAVTCYLDRNGYVMLPVEGVDVVGAASGADPLPLLTGVVGTELRPGRRVESPQMHAALKLVTAFARSPMAGIVDLKSIDLSAPQVLQMRTRQGNEITFGLDGHERQLQRWRVVYDFARSEQKSIATLDLSVTNNVPARWQTATAEPPANSKPAKPPRYRKKHV